MISSPTPSTEGVVLVVGQVARDLVLRVDRLPGAGAGAPVRERRETLGGKGSNQALGLRRAGVTDVRLLGVVGEDAVGTDCLERAAADGLDVDGVVRRGATALLVDLVEDGGTRRLLEHVPPEALLTAADVASAAEAFVSADTVVVQLQQPAEAVGAAATAAVRNGALLVTDGAVEPSWRERLLTSVDVLRADAQEATSWTDVEVRTFDDARRAARVVLDAGPSVVALGVPDQGDLVAWAGGEVELPFGDDRVVDPTGGGDAFVAALVASLRRGEQPGEAGRRASSAAAAVVVRPGGRPADRS